MLHSVHITDFGAKKERNKMIDIDAHTERRKDAKTRWRVMTVELSI